MTDRAQFEAMLEALINDDQAAAKEIFHNIVVGKSREIYEELLAEDFDVAEAAEEEEEESTEEEGSDNPFGGEDEEGSDDEEATDDEEGEEDGEGEEDSFGGDDEEGLEGEGDIEDRVMDLEDALEDLKAEFEQLLAGEEHEEEQNPGIHGGELDGLPGMGDEEEFGAEEPADEMMFEYKDMVKVPAPKHGDDGVNNKSLIDNMKNDMGGTTANIAKNFSTTSGGTKGGLAAPTTKPQDGGNVNVPGAKNATKLKTVPAGHGAEKAGKKETADNKQSLLRQAKAGGVRK